MCLQSKLYNPPLLSSLVNSPSFFTHHPEAAAVDVLWAILRRGSGHGGHYKGRQQETETVIEAKRKKPGRKKEELRLFFFYPIAVPPMQSSSDTQQ